MRWRSRKKRPWADRRRTKWRSPYKFQPRCGGTQRGVSSIACAAANLGELFSILDEKFPELKPHLRDEAGQLRRFLNIYVNDEDIRFLGGPAYSFQEGDEVLLVPSIAGGTR
jgi:sulfur-carrier protein